MAFQKKYSSDKKWNAKTVKWWALPKPFINAWMLNLSRLNSSSKEILVTWWLWGKLVNDVLAAIVQSKGAFGEKRRTLKAHLKTPQKNSVEVKERPTYQYELPHIDNYNKSGGKDVGADNHLGVLKAVDQAVWRLWSSTIALESLIWSSTVHLKLRMKRSWRAAEKLQKAVYTETVT